MLKTLIKILYKTFSVSNLAVKYNY